MDGACVFFLLFRRFVLILLYLYCKFSSSELVMFSHLFFFSRPSQTRVLEANMDLSSNLLGTDQALNFLL